MEDEALLASIRGGDPDGYRRLVERETQPLYRFAVRIIGNPADAEDVVQDTFIAAFRSLGTYRGEGSLRAWLMRIAARLAYRRVASPAGIALDALAEPESDVLAFDPVGRALDGETRASIRLAVATLPDPYREVVVLRYFAQLSVEETAVTLGRSINTTKSQLQRGLRRLRLALAVEIAA